jgi:hypothetical protein
MSPVISSRRNQADIDRRRRRNTEPDHIHESNRTAGWLLPEDRHDRRRNRNRLMVLAAALPIVQFLRWLFR